MAVGKRVMDRTPHLSDMHPATIDSHSLRCRLSSAACDTEPHFGPAPVLTPTTSIAYPDKERNTAHSGFTPMSPLGRPRSVSRQISPVCTRHSLGSSSMSSYGGAVSPPDEVLLSPTVFSRTRADSVRSLKLIAGLPSESKLSDCVTLNNESLSELVRDDFDPETRPPSPRPNDREQALLQHSKQMQIWEDSMRLSHSRSQTHDMDLASISFTRTSFSSDGPESLKRQAFSASTESDEYR